MHYQPCLLACIASTVCSAPAMQPAMAHRHAKRHPPLCRVLIPMVCSNAVQSCSSAAVALPCRRFACTRGLMHACSASARNSCLCMDSSSAGRHFKCPVARGATGGEVKIVQGSRSQPRPEAGELTAPCKPPTLGTRGGRGWDGALLSLSEHLRATSDEAAPPHSRASRMRHHHPIPWRHFTAIDPQQPPLADTHR